MASEINLHLLDETETGELIAHYFGKDPARQLLPSVYRRTRGNAFFTEEVLRSLTESGAVQLGSNGWEVVDPNQVIIPESMKLAVIDRVALLGESAQDVLNQAAVLGQEFALHVLQRLTGRSEDELLEMVEQAQAARILIDRSVVGEERFAFLDDQIQEVLYADIPPVRRRRYHRRAGQALEEVYGEHPDAHLEALARHFLEGNDLEKGAEYAYRAGEKNERQFHWSLAYHLYTQAIQMFSKLPKTDQNLRRCVDVILKQITVSVVTDDPDESMALMKDADAIAQSLVGSEQRSGDDQVRLTRIRYWMGRIEFYRNEHLKSIVHHQYVIEQSRRLGINDLGMMSTNAIGRSKVIQDRFHEATAMIAPSIGLFEETMNWREWISATGFTGVSLAASSDYQAGLAKGEQALNRALDLGFLTSIALSNLSLSIIHLHGGNFLRAANHGQATIEIAEQAEARLTAYDGHGMHAWAESRLGHHDVAIESMSRFRTFSQGLGGHFALADWLAAADAEIALNAGHPEEAIALAGQTVTYARSIGGIFAEGLAQRVWGQALAILNPASLDDALEHLALSLCCFEEGDARLEAARTRVVWGQLLRDHGDLAAREHLAKAAAQFEASGLTEEWERTWALLSD